MQLKSTYTTGLSKTGRSPAAGIGVGLGDTASCDEGSIATGRRVVAEVGEPLTPGRSEEWEPKYPYLLGFGGGVLGEG